MKWVIMPYRNAVALTRAAVEDVMAQTLPDTRLLLLDNGSGPDGRELAAEATQRWPGDVIVWHHDPPLPSLAATWNLALRFVWRLGGTEALVVNNDVRLHPQLYEALKAAQYLTDAWFLTACNIAPLQVEVGKSVLPFDADFLGVRGGPDFSCFLIQEACHRWFQFDERFSPAYHEDNDFHRRLQLAGLGDRIFSLCIPYYHVGSGTLKDDAQLRAAWGPKFEACQRYYVEKWGGLPGHETWEYPFEWRGFSTDGTPWPDTRCVYTGQGRPGHFHTIVEGGWPWDAPLTT